MAGCDIDHYGRAPQPLKGRFLSIFDEEDDVAGSCKGDFKLSSGGIVTKEIVLNSNHNPPVLLVCPSYAKRVA